MRNTVNTVLKNLTNEQILKNWSQREKSFLWWLIEEKRVCKEKVKFRKLKSQILIKKMFLCKVSEDILDLSNVLWVLSNICNNGYNYPR